MRSKFMVFALAVAATLSICAAAAPATTIDQSAAEQKLDSKKLVGIWTCSGTSLGKAVSAKIRWYHLEDYSLWMTLHPTPKTGNQTYLEQWTWEDESDTAGYRDWRTTPDPKSFDQASYTSNDLDFPKGKMTWVRHAQASTERRVFTMLGKDHLSFHESYGDPSAPPHVVYQLDCKRTLAQEPPPQ